jgi:hypothetical protein
MPSLAAYPNGNNIYIYSVKAFRNLKNKPDNKKTIVGRIDKSTFKPTFNSDFLSAVDSGTSEITKQQVNDFINQDFSIRFSSKLINDTENTDSNLTIEQSSVINNDEFVTINTTIKKLDLFDNIKEFGIIYFLLTLCKSIGLYDILKSIFNENLLNKILTICFYLIISNKSLRHCWKWVDSIESITNCVMSSQRISEIFDSITFDNRTKFFKNWYQLIKDNEYVALDTISISSYANNISEVEFDHSKENNKIPQINLCVLFGEQSGLPIYQSIYNGSLNDVTTLLSTIEEITSLTGCNEFITVLDRVFFSEKNINILSNKKLGKGFLISVPFTNSFAIKFIDKYRHKIINGNNAIKSAKETLYGLTKEIIYGKKQDKFFIHIFYNPFKELIERKKFLMV